MLIDIDTIIVTDRQRAEMTQSKLHELEFSIIRFGLLHPIVVAEAPDNKLQLVAGGRRLMTIAGLHNAGKVIYHNGRVITPGYIPATFINGDDLRRATEISVLGLTVGPHDGAKMLAAVKGVLAVAEGGASMSQPQNINRSA